jgi:hypothetical protein
MRPRLRLLAAIALLACACGGATARADLFGPIGLVSAGTLSGEGVPARTEQALYAHDPAISADGRYVAFDGYFAGRTGVWRRQLQPPYAVQPVAVGAVAPGSEACVAEAPCDAELPSISEDGRYVSFTTTARLDPVDSTGPGANVYVRDMDVPESQSCAEEGSLHPATPCAFTLVSAADGTARGLSYENGGSDAYGAVAAGRSAISADGGEVAFVTTAPSDLAGPGTPALQVAVRNLDTGETELVSTQDDRETGQALPGRPVAQTEGSTTYGAVFTPGATVPGFPFDNRAYDAPPALGASISADGSTVAWMGRDVGAQARTLPGEHLPGSYAEPLWRRIADGPTAPTRRVTGGSQPEDAACQASGEQILPGLTQQSLADPCQGPFATESQGVWSGTAGNAIPQLSANGETVAFVSRAPLLALGSDFGRSASGEADDLYVANMSEGLSRTEALRALTQLASGNEADPASAAPIVDLAISPDGTQVAFATERVQFPLTSPAYVSPPRTVAGMSELFDADLADETLTRVSVGYEGGGSERPHRTFELGEADPYVRRTDGALSPSFSNDGNQLAFASTAANLVSADGNVPSEEATTGSADGSSVYEVARSQFAAVATETYTTPAPANPTLPPEWRLFATAHSLPGGRVQIVCEAPGAGVLSSYVTSRVPNGSPASTARARRARSALVNRYVAEGFAWPEGQYGQITTLTLRLGPGFISLSKRPGGLAGTARLIFSPDDLVRPALELDIPVLFRRGRAVAPAARRARTGRRR